MALIQIKNLSKSYYLGETIVPALRDINLAFGTGEFTAVVGASGSGKSTLLNMIGCIDNPDEGSVIVDGVDVTKLSDDEKSALRNQKIGFIFQSFNLVPVLSVFENVELPLMLNPNLTKAERHDRVRLSLKDVGIENLSRNRPDQLSGGQRQRVAIARALAGNPALVLADEPTANLDSGTSHKIIDLMCDLNKKRGVTFVFSTHDEKLMGFMTRLIHISDGRLKS